MSGLWVRSILWDVESYFEQKAVDKP